MNSLVNALKTSWLAKIGLLCIVLGTVLKVYSSSEGLPKRSELKTFEGTLTEASRTTRTSAKRGVTSVVFNMTIAGPANTPPLKLTMPSTEITQEQVVSMLQRRVKVEYDGDNDIYSIASNGRDVIAYDATIEKRTGALLKWAERGTFVIVLGAHLLALGWFLAWRRSKKQPAPVAA